ncbi:uncharacterized protein F4807DRAFT_133236 [Annulohypoxylon truncatum]|uniref:uncharacterized protein n=1 Tax=Annulohypoxylon truncatum TaxID=327061 RepID=UPI0020077D2E|nr:uncharacterized protein F4807DRAFT_133236 [Annulohypoxylon truncatum]KAI1208772.1 hypothetical protein F4807DRAFT_133236 [Annulohypoxylon truncatum]
MDPLLKEKIAFFECLETFMYEDAEDALDEHEESYRKQTREFLSGATITPANGPRPTQKGIDGLPGAPSKRIVSDPISTNSDSEVEIIAVTPRNRDSKVRGPSLQTSTLIGTDATVFETAAARKQPLRRSTRSTRPTLRARHSSPQTDPSPSVRMGKRKKEAPLKLVPEAQQIFKGLSFYYIPNDDINPARRLQITKAREHGVTWCRELVNATHIIVDKKLTYADIERYLQDDPKWPEKVIVNANYPIDCLRHRIIANPAQGQYKVTGTPATVKQPPVAPLSSNDSDVSLKLKPRRKKAAKITHAPILSTPTSHELSTQESILLVPPSQVRQNQNTVETSGPSREQKSAIPEDNDELTQCISEMKTASDNSLGDALLDDGDILGSSPTADEDEASPNSENLAEDGPRKRRASSRRKDPDWQEKFICMKGGTKDHTDDSSPNADTIKVLQQMLEMHILANDNFRIRAYRLAIETLRAQPKKIRTAEEARALPNIGRIADKIEEIVNTNRLRQLEYAQDDSHRKVMALFLQIYGVGHSVAQKWISQGFRTLDDLKKGAELNDKQKIGLEHFDDINTRIPRKEVEALASCVKRTAAVIDPRVELIVGGSYRRGADSSGDIDLIITKGGTTSVSELTPFLDRLVNTLTEDGFLTAELAAHHGSIDDGGGSKWHGCCVLPESAFPGPKGEYRPIWRRIDLLLVPQCQLGAALIYFTGNDIFNRSIRLLARKKGMRLNQRGLYSDVLHDRNNQMTAGTLIGGDDEKKIFEILGVRWREPHERWCG